MNKELVVFFKDNERLIKRGDWDSVLKNSEINLSSRHIRNEFFQFCLSNVPNFLLKITYIPEFAFGEDNKEFDIYLPDNIKEVKEFAFANSGVGIVRLSDSLTYLDSHAFYSCSNIRSIYIPDSVIFVGAGAFRYCNNLDIISVPSTLDSEYIENLKQGNKAKLKVRQ